MQILLNGIGSGCAIALLALAFQAVYLPTRVFFVGLAGIYSCTPFVAHTVLTHGGGWLFAVIVSALISVSLGLLLEWANHGRLSRRLASSGAHLVSSLGTYIVLVQVIALVWGNDTRLLRTELDTVTRWGDLQITGAHWTSLGVTVGLIGGFSFFLKRSDLGIRLRALADNPTQFALLGYNVGHYRLLAFGLAGIFVTASALLTAYDSGFDPHIGLYAVLLSVVAVIIGGKSTFLGPVLGALLLGVLREQVTFHLSASWQEAATFLLLAITLMFRPQGLLGHKVRLEAAK